MPGLQEEEKDEEEGNLQVQGDAQEVRKAHPFRRWKSHAEKVGQVTSSQCLWTIYRVARIEANGSSGLSIILS